MHVVRNRRIQVLHNACVVLFHEKPKSSSSVEVYPTTLCWIIGLQVVLSIRVVPAHYMGGSRVIFSRSGKRTHPVTLLPRDKKGHTRSRGHFSLRGFFRVSLHGLSERGTTPRSLTVTWQI